jgi:hypothetical protein
MAQNYYSVEIQNEYLGKFRRVTGRTRQEVQLKAADQLLRWHAQELRAKERAELADMKQMAMEATDDAVALIQSYRDCKQHLM